MRSLMASLALTVGCLPVFAANSLGEEPPQSSGDQRPALSQRATEGDKEGGEAAANDARPSQGESNSPQERKLRDAAGRFSVEHSIASRSLSYLIESPAVQAELRMGKRQLDELLHVLIERRIEQGQVIRARIARVNAGESGPGTPSFKDLMAGFQAETDQILLMSLNPKQRRRLRQISLQAQGPLAAFFDPDVAEKLALQPKQIQKLRFVLGDGTDKFSLSDPKTGKPPSLSASAQDVEAAILSRQEGNLRKRDAALGLLSERQRQVYNSAYGEPFDLSKLLNPPPAPKPKEDAPQPKAESSQRAACAAREFHRRDDGRH